MIDVLKEIVIKEAKLTRDSDRIFQIYEGEIEVLIRNWCKDGFRQDKIDEIVADMVYLLNTARIRLGVLK